MLAKEMKRIVDSLVNELQEYKGASILLEEARYQLHEAIDAQDREIAQLRGRLLGSATECLDLQYQLSEQAPITSTGVEP